MTVECPYCEKPLPDERAACCGEVGHGVVRDAFPSTETISSDRLNELIEAYTFVMTSDVAIALRELQRLRSPGGARVEQDAARYQFLRGLHDPGPNDPRVHTLDQQHDPVQVRLCFGDDLDAAVDAAMRQP